MPNWVYGTLVVTGKENDVSDFVKATTSRVPVYEWDKNKSKEVPTKETERRLLDFNKIIPMPEELRDTESPALIPQILDNMSDEEKEKTLKQKAKILKKLEALVEKYGASDWYSWSNANWGTKWPACDVSMISARQHVHYKFNTAWSMPTPVLKAMGTMFPNLSFEYTCIEESGSFASKMLIENGEVQESTYSQGDSGFAKIAQELGSLITISLLKKTLDIMLNDVKIGPQN